MTEAGAQVGINVEGGDIPGHATCPLFNAAIDGRVDVLEFLLEECPSPKEFYIKAVMGAMKTGKIKRKAS